MAERLTDEIRIQDLNLRCIVGVYPEERGRKQNVVIQVRLEADLGPASVSDKLEDTVDYKAIKKRIVAEVECSAFQLIERLAGRVVEICLEAPGVRAVEVEVGKPGALRFARTVSVVLRRRREGVAS